MDDDLVPCCSLQQYKMNHCMLIEVVSGLLFFPPEKITFTNVPSPQEFTEGDNAIIVCDVKSSPPPTVLWKYKGAKIQFEKDGKSKVSHFICKKWCVT